MNDDDWELPFDEEDRSEKGRHRRGAQRKRKQQERGGRGRGRGRTMVALLMAFLLLGSLGVVGWYGFDRIQAALVTPDFDGDGTGEVVVEIPAGSLTEIANTLVTAGVIKGTKAFIEASEANPLSEKIQPGFYKVRKEMKAETALAMLLDLKNKVTNRVTIPEGRSAKSIYLLLSKATKIPVKDFEAVAKNPKALGIPDWWYVREDGVKVTRSIEGFLFPSTYEINPDATAETLLKEMVQNFLTVTGEIKFADTVKSKREISPYEALIVASLAQAEAGNAEDLGKIARVAYNRVYSKDHYCDRGNGLTGCLEFDVGVNYYWELTGKPTKASKDMSKDDLFDPKNPYRMHGKAGLIPTPINNPGKAALQGAMDPPPGGWLFFVAIDKEGHSEFAETAEQHERNVEKAKANGVLN